MQTKPASARRWCSHRSDRSARHHLAQALILSGFLLSAPAFSSFATPDASHRPAKFEPIGERGEREHSSRPSSPLSIDYLTVSKHATQACEKSPVVSSAPRNNRTLFIDFAHSMQQKGYELASYIRTGLLNRDPVTVPPVSLKEASPMPAIQMAFESNWLVERFDAESGKGVHGPMPAFDEDSPQGEFLADVWLHARAAADDVGVPATFIIAQAALETGWGRAQLVDRSGRNSHNLFNIKAGRGWTGKTVSLPVREYESGRRVVRHETFRAYDSYREAFADYARLLTENKRYQRVLGEEDPARFAYGLQRAGFATDPAYGRKIVSIIRKIEKEAMS